MCVIELLIVERTDNIMDSITSIIISGVLYDLIKKGAVLTFQQVFGNFYGIRITQNMHIYNEFLDEINKEENLLNKEELIEEILTEKKQYIDIFERDLYNTNFAKRLDYVIHIMNQSRKYKSINLEYLGEFLGFESVNELLKYYKYEEEPTYRFCEEIANKLGVNAEWLKNGDMKGNVFKTCLPIIYDAEEFLKHRKTDEYEFHFVLNNDINKRNIIVVKKYNELKFEYYPHPIVFNSQVGAGGRGSLLSLYKFLKEIAINGNEITNVHVVTEETFNKMLEGKKYCGIIEQYNTRELKFILDDFLDIHHNYPISTNYGEWYGEDFLKVQRIVEDELKYE